MGVFLYSNRPVNVSKIEEVFVSRGHKNVKNHQFGNEIIIHSGKTLVNNVGELGSEALGANNGDFILGVGTYIYKGKFGDDALGVIWEDIESILKENSIYGHYAFVVRKNGTTYVFNDMSGTLRLYVVTDDDEGTVITSSMVAAIASIEEPKFDKDRLSGFLASEFANEIPFVKGVDNINSQKYYCRKENTSGIWIRREIEEVKRIDTLEDAVPFVRSLFKQQTHQLQAFGNEKCSIELTGGLDSRLSTSNLDADGFNYEFIHYPLFGPDKEVADIISENEQKRMLVQTNIPIGEKGKEFYGEFDYGFNYFRQYANPRWVVENRLQFSGALGECLSTPLSIDYLDDSRIESLIQKLAGSKLMNSECLSGYYRYLRNYFVSRGFDVDEQMDEKTLYDFEQMFEGQLCGDFMYNSGAQAQLYFYNMYVEWHFNHYVSDIAYKVKNARKLSIACIKETSPKYASYPFVSRRRTKRKSVKAVSELPLHYFSFNGVKKLLPKTIVDFLYEKMGRSFSKTRFNAIDLDMYNDIVEVEEIKKHRNLYSNTLNRMYSVEVLRRKFNITY